MPTAPVQWRFYRLPCKVLGSARLSGGAVYWPDPNLLARELVPGSAFASFVRHRINLIPSEAKPRVLDLQGPRYAIPDREAGTWETWEPLPAGIDPGHGIQEGLEAKIVRLLGHHSALECRLLTLAPLDLVEAMRADGARADWLAVTGGDLTGTDGVGREAIRVAAGEAATGRYWTLAVLDGALGEEDLAACIAEAITDLPHPESVVLVTTGDSIVACRIVAEALAMARSTRPAFAGEALAAQGDGRRPGLRALASKAAACLDRSLEALWREAPLTIALHTSVAAL